MKILKTISLLPLAFGSILAASANEFKFDNIKYDEFEKGQNLYEPKDKLDKFIIRGSTYASQFVPLMNDGYEASEYTNMLFNDGKRLLVKQGFDFVNAAANNSIQNIPFFAQTTVNFSGGTDSDTSFSVNSFMKLGQLDVDDEGDIKTLTFSQARIATATNSDGATTNLGLGIRHRPNDFSMIGANAFWDYRMTDYMMLIADLVLEENIYGRILNLEITGIWLLQMKT